MSISKEKVTCIIPAYNEELRISAVLGVVKDTKDIDEVIIVNDGSTDHTASIIANYRNLHSEVREFKVINFEKNQGKAAAMARGIEESTGEIILFLDSDLKGLTQDHIRALLSPVINRQVDMTLSYRDNSGEPFFKIDMFSGERALRKSILLQIKDLATLRYAVEAAINRYVIDHGLSWKSVVCKGLTFVQKEEKMNNNLLGTLSHYKMYWDISRKVHGILKMYWIMGTRQKKD